MGETRVFGPPERPIYPGLVRPYADDTNYVNQRNFILNDMTKAVITVPEHDPFSIYDDESAQDHYFFLPAGKLDLNSFKKTSTMRKTNLPTCSGCSVTKTERERSLKCKQTTHCQTKLKNMNRPTRCHSATDSGRCNSLSNPKRPSSDEYCSLAKDAMVPKYPGINRSSNSPIDEENFRKFALKLIRTNSGSSSDISNKKSNTNDYHLSSRTMKDSRVECDDSNKHICKKKKSYTTDECIDYCSCMICVKAARYHFAGDRDSFIEEPCSCAGNRKNTAGRWLCMGIMTLFLPCLLCYLPAKLCQNSCYEKGTNSRLKSRQRLVRYVKEPDYIKKEDWL